MGELGVASESFSERSQTVQGPNSTRAGGGGPLAIAFWSSCVCGRAEKALKTRWSRWRGVLRIEQHIRSATSISSAATFLSLRWPRDAWTSDARPFPRRAPAARPALAFLLSRSGKRRLDAHLRSAASHVATATWPRLQRTTSRTSAGDAAITGTRARPVHTARRRVEARLIDRRALLLHPSIEPGRRSERVQGQLPHAPRARHQAFDLSQAPQERRV